MTTFSTHPDADAGFKQASGYGSSTGLPGAGLPGAGLPGAGLLYAGAVTPAQAWQLAQSGAAAIVDVRSRFEYEFVGRIPGSQLIEWRIYEGNAEGGVASKPNPAFLDQLRAAHATDTPLLLLCRSAVRSHHAAIAATAAGFTRVYNILEGFEGDQDKSGKRGVAGGWRKAGLPWIQG